MGPITANLTLRLIAFIFAIVFIFLWARLNEINLSNERFLEQEAARKQGWIYQPDGDLWWNVNDPGCRVPNYDFYVLNHGLSRHPECTKIPGWDFRIDGNGRRY